MKKLSFALITLTTLGILYACVSASGITSVKSCEDVIKEFANSSTPDEQSGGMPLQDGGFLFMLVKEDESVRGVVISSPHTLTQLQHNESVEFAPAGTCALGELRYNITKIVSITKPKT